MVMLGLLRNSLAAFLAVDLVMKVVFLWYLFLIYSALGRSPEFRDECMSVW